jgi:GT2 family glycosyltransferase
MKAPGVTTTDLPTGLKPVSGQRVVQTLGVVIATIGRREIVAETICSMASRRSVPAIVVVVGRVEPDLPKLPTELPFQIQLSATIQRGLSFARNQGIRWLPASIEFVTFLDDDMEIHDDYCIEVENVFRSAPEVAGFSGYIMANGDIERIPARQQLDGYQIPPGMPIFGLNPKGWPGLYGCSMNIRRRVLDQEQFDEQLLLGMEDIEMGFRVNRHGQVGGSARCAVVHLAVRSGRISEVGIGYAQIINPLYFAAKGIGYPRWATWWQTLIKMPLTNLFFWWFPALDKSRSLADRKGRFRGNILGLRDVCRGEIKPLNLLQVIEKLNEAEKHKAGKG